MDMSSQVLKNFVLILVKIRKDILLVKGVQDSI